jgi:hypothetical protein
MTQAERYVLIVAEASADREAAHALARRVLCEEHAWLDGLLGDGPPEPDGRPTDVCPWQGVGPTEPLLKWTDVGEEARRRGVRAHGHFGGEPGAPDAQAARKALLIAAELTPRPAAVVLSRDLDDQPERARGFEQARQVSAWPFAVVVALANPMRECWVLAGFAPENEAEEAALAELRQQLGHDPRERAHELAAKDKAAARSPKRVLKALIQGREGRELRCLLGAELETLRARGEGSGLKDYLDEVRGHLGPIFTEGRPSAAPSGARAMGL